MATYDCAFKEPLGPLPANHDFASLRCQFSGETVTSWRCRDTCALTPERSKTEDEISPTVIGFPQNPGKPTSLLHSVPPHALTTKVSPKCEGISGEGAVRMERTRNGSDDDELDSR
jgi:hypothetical protein